MLTAPRGTPTPGPACASASDGERGRGGPRTLVAVPGRARGPCSPQGTSAPPQLAGGAWVVDPSRFPPVTGGTEPARCCPCSSRRWPQDAFPSVLGADRRVPGLVLSSSPVTGEAHLGHPEQQAEALGAGGRVTGRKRGPCAPLTRRSPPEDVVREPVGPGSWVPVGALSCPSCEVGRSLSAPAHPSAGSLSGSTLRFLSPRSGSASDCCASWREAALSSVCIFSEA